MQHKLALVALSAFAAVGSAHASRGQPVFVPPQVASVLATDTATAGVTQLITFSLALAVDNKFVLDLGNTPASNVSFALYSGSTLLQPTTPLSFIGSSVVADYAGLQLNTPYTFKLTLPSSSTWTVSSLDKAGSVSVTAVPEAESALLALAGAGVVAAVVRRRRAR
jgi:hypothetical protein